ncbi:hypothetical protein [Pseudomonas fluorescens]|uniref:hypothetical protein n=1 Tax=Pseudomonas fluorescens TaxID=294 RepID=UPI001CD202E0|nr:hypothetical protein [Pseudomonas fluorescens]
MLLMKFAVVLCVQEHEITEGLLLFDFDMFKPPFRNKGLLPMSTKVKVPQTILSTLLDATEDLDTARTLQKACRRIY